MNYTAIKTALVTLTKAVTGIGKVYGEAQHTADWSTFLSMHTITNPHDAAKKIICVAWWERESSPSAFTRDEASTALAQEDTDRWKLTLIYGFHADETYPSEGDFNDLADRIRDKFMMSDLTSWPSAVQEIGPVSIDTAGLFMFSDVLCHKAECSIQIRQRSTSIT